MAGLELPDLISSIFNANAKPGQPMSLEALQSRRRIAEAIMAGRRKDPYPKNLGEGLTYLGESIADKAQLDRLDEEDQKLAALQPGKRDAGDRAAAGNSDSAAAAGCDAPSAAATSAGCDISAAPPAAVRPAPTPTVGPGFPEAAGGNAPAGFRPEPGLNAGNLMDSIQFRSDQGDPPLGMQPQPPAPESPTFPPPDSQLNRRRAPGPADGPRSPQCGSASPAGAARAPYHRALPRRRPQQGRRRLLQPPLVEHLTSRPMPRLLKPHAWRRRRHSRTASATPPTRRPSPISGRCRATTLPRSRYGSRATCRFPDIGPEARRPPPLPQSDTELRLRASWSTRTQRRRRGSGPRQQLKLHEAYREKQQAQQQEDYTHERGKRDELVKAQREYNLGEDKRVMDYHISALDAKIKQATIANQPVEAEKLSYERDKLRRGGRRRSASDSRRQSPELR